jgi:hypothetical protein
MIIDPADQLANVAIDQARVSLRYSALMAS